MMERFNLNCKTPDEAVSYMEARSKQLLRLGYTKRSITAYEFGCIMISEKDNELFQSIYLIESYRGKGLYKGLVKHKILTSNMCDLEGYLGSKGIDYVSEDLNPTMEYHTISNYYGGECAKRSGVHLMNHIDEGLYILEKIGASEIAKRAYCVHPIFQSDADLVKVFSYSGIGGLRDPLVITAAVEYRSVANEYLSNREIKSIDEIRLSPLKDVNDMLIADKIQNRKDFELYHLGTHPRSKQLDIYFKNWLQKLGVSEDMYQEIKNKLIN